MGDSGVAIGNWVFPYLLVLLVPPSLYPSPPPYLPNSRLGSHPPERMTLTGELLQKRLNAPIQEDGFSTIDLRQLDIDLTPENAEFRDQFYQRLRSSINRSNKPLGIDLSQSLIQGEFKASEIGLQTPLAGEALSSLFTSVERGLQEDPRLAQLSNSQLQAGIIPYVTVLRGSIKLVDRNLVQGWIFPTLSFCNACRHPALLLSNRVTSQKLVLVVS